MIKKRETGKNQSSAEKWLIKLRKKFSKMYSQKQSAIDKRVNNQYMLQLNAG